MSSIPRRSRLFCPAANPVVTRQGGIPINDFPEGVLGKRRRYDPRSCDVVGGSLLRQIGGRWKRKGEFAEVVFDHRLPNGNRTQKDIIRCVLNSTLKRFWQLGVGSDVSKKNVGIQQ